MLMAGSKMKVFEINKIYNNFCPNFLHFPEPPSFVQKVWDFLFPFVVVKTRKKSKKVFCYLVAGSQQTKWIAVLFVPKTKWIANLFVALVW